MIHLALTIASGLFLTAFAATVLWLVVYAVGLVILGTRELCKFYWSEIKKEFRSVR